MGGMRFVLEIDLDNGAFHEEGGLVGVELERILTKVGGALSFTLQEGDYGGIRDINGNTVGSWEVR